MLSRPARYKLPTPIFLNAEDDLAVYITITPPSLGEWMKSEEAAILQMGVKRGLQTTYSDHSTLSNDREDIRYSIRMLIEELEVQIEIKEPVEMPLIPIPQQCGDSIRTRQVSLQVQAACFDVDDVGEVGRAVCWEEGFADREVVGGWFRVDPGDLAGVVGCDCGF